MNAYSARAIKSSKFSWSCLQFKNFVSQFKVQERVPVPQTAVIVAHTGMNAYTTHGHACRSVE
jgi:hypothetical protein